MRHLFVGAFVVLLAGAALAQDVSTLESVFTYQASRDTSLNAATVLVQDTAGTKNKYSGAFGYSRRSQVKPMWLDSMVRVNNLGELLVTAAALKLVETSVLPSLDSSIPAAFLPRQVPLVNPSATSTPITLRHLMTHTSTLSDASFATSRRTSPTAVSDLSSFIIGYFITSSGGTNVLSSSIFTTGTPGAAASYNYAKINTALLTFIIERAVIQNPSLVTGGIYTALAYVRETIIAPLGLSNTITLTLVGGVPTVSYPAGGQAWTNAIVEDRMPGNIVVNTKPLHPAYFSDYMTFMSTSDMARLARSLWLDTSTTSANLATVGTTMRSVNNGVTVSNVAGQNGQGLGIYYFNGATMCASALATNAVARCPLTAAHSVWGLVATGLMSQVAVYCTDAVSSQNPTCVVTTHSFDDSSPNLKSADLSQAMAAAAFQLAIGDTSTVTQTTVTTSSRSSLYGVWVFLGVLGVLVFVLVASYFTEYIIQPAPVISGVPVPQSMMPQTANRPPTDTYFNSQ